MARKSKWRRGVWLLLPLALFFAARDKLSWRPQKIMDITFGVPEYVVISPNERFVANFSGRNVSYKVPSPLDLIVRDLQNGQDIRARGKYPGIEITAFDEQRQKLALGWREADEEYDTKRIGVSFLVLNGGLRDFEIPRGAFPEEDLRQLRFSPDGKTIWMASDANLYSWDIASGKLTWKWRKEGEEIEEGDESLPFTSAISTDCRYYFRADRNSGYAVWDIAKNKCLLSTKLPAHNLLSFSPDAALLVCAELDGKRNASVLDSMTGRVLWQSTAGMDLKLSNTVAIVQNKDHFEVREARTGKLLRWLSAEPNVDVIASDSVDWLYTVNNRNELFRSDCAD